MSIVLYQQAEGGGRDVQLREAVVKATRHFASCHHKKACRMHIFWIRTKQQCNATAALSLCCSERHNITGDNDAEGRLCTWTAAPKATASSGFMLLESSRPLKKSDSRLCTLGIRVDPPTSTMSCTAPLSVLASCRQIVPLSVCVSL